MTTPRRIEPLGIQDLRVGDAWESPARTVTSADVSAFAGVSGDFNPIHVDHESAKSGPFREPVAHGLLGLSIVSGLTSHAPKVDTLAFLAILEWKFLQPIAFGDTIHVISRVEAIEPQSRGRRGIVTWHRRVVNQKSQIVQEGRTQTLVNARKTVKGAGEAESQAP